MIFTIGHKESYDQGLKDLGLSFRKLGRCLYEGSPYVGGIVFATAEEAESFRLPKYPDYAVYGLDADWDTMTYVIEDGSRRLLDNARIIAL